MMGVRTDSDKTSRSPTLLEKSPFHQRLVFLAELGLLLDFVPKKIGPVETWGGLVAAGRGLGTQEGYWKIYGYNK